MTYDAVGGPALEHTGADGYSAGPTDEGSYIMAGAWKQSKSKLYPAWSTLAWGTPLRENTDGSISVYVDGKWQPLFNFTKVTRDEIKEMYYQLYGKSEIPKTWVFNDFGHLTTYYFKDKNNNKKLDKGERIESELIHTTPPDEANTALGIKVELSESHGCVHVKPRDIDEMVARGYIAKGNAFVVHSYSEKTPTDIPCADAKAPFEVHFFPGPKKIYVFGEI